MANQITFTVTTDAPYTTGERENLLDSFIEFIVGEDRDVDTDSIEVEIVDVDSVNDIENQKKREIVEEFLKKATFTGSVFVSLDGENLLQADLG